MNFGVTLTFAPENLDQIDTECKSLAYVENFELNGSGWTYNRTTIMIIDFFEDITKGASWYVERPGKDLSLLNIQNKKDNLREIWYIVEQLHPVKVKACT